MGEIELFGIFENKLSKLLETIKICFWGKNGNDQASKFIKALLGIVTK
jgi:hypothetical protein